MKEPVFPISVLVLGKEIHSLDGEPYSFGSRKIEARAFAFSVTRLIPDKMTEQFSIAREPVSKIEYLLVMGPGLIEMVTMGHVIVYDHRQHSDEGTLFCSPFRVLEPGWLMNITVRCAPELFMLEAPMIPRESVSEEHPIIDDDPSFPRLK